MNTLHETILRQGAWMKDAIEIVQDHNPDDALSYIFDFETVAAYVQRFREKLVNEVIEMLNSPLEFSDTGEPVILDEVFLMDALECGYSNYNQLKRNLRSGKVTNTNLVQIHNYLHDPTLIRQI